MTAVSIFRRWRTALIDALFPLECVACGEEGWHCCPACLAAVRFRDTAVGDADPLRAVFGAYAYADPLIRTLIGDLKYRGYRAAGPALEALTRRWSAKHGAALLAASSVVVPVPLHELRRRERGFNQAAVIARALADSLGLACRGGMLVRIRPTAPQAKIDDDRRAANVAAAFTVPAGTPLAGLNVILVDDVWTTGATMRACARALLAAGAESVTGFALAAANDPLQNSKNDVRCQHRPRGNEERCAEW